MPILITSALVLICVTAFGCLAVAVVAYGVHDMLYASRRVVRIEVRDPWTRLLDDARRRGPKLPRLSAAIVELRREYGELLGQRRQLLSVLSAHERTPGENSQGAFLARQLQTREDELERVRERIRELHALVVVRRLGTPRADLPVADSFIGRLRAEAEVERIDARRGYTDRACARH